jgi:hypothetical protein
MVHFEDPNLSLQTVDPVGPGVVSGAQDDQLRDAVLDAFIQVVIDVPGTEYYFRLNPGKIQIPSSMSGPPSGW